MSTTQQCYVILVNEKEVNQVQTQFYL